MQITMQVTAVENEVKTNAALFGKHPTLELCLLSDFCINERPSLVKQHQKLCQLIFLSALVKLDGNQELNNIKDIR